MLCWTRTRKQFSLTALLKGDQSKMKGDMMIGGRVEEGEMKEAAVEEGKEEETVEEEEIVGEGKGGYITEQQTLPRLSLLLTHLARDSSS